MSEQLLLTNFSNIVLTVVLGAFVLLGNSKGDGKFPLKFIYVRFYTYFIENILHTSLQASCTFLFSFVWAFQHIHERHSYLHPCSPLFLKINIALIYTLLWLTILATWKKICSFFDAGNNSFLKNINFTMCVCVRAGVGGGSVF